MPTLAAFPWMLERGRKREGLRVCRAAWLFGVTVREYRELEGGERNPDFATWRRLCGVLAGRSHLTRRSRSSRVGSIDSREVCM